jgi:hypothetical protein
VAEPVGAPTVEREAVSKVTGDSAVLEGEVNPRGASTVYHFEYGACATLSTCAASGYGVSVPVPDGLVGGGFEVHALVPVNVQGLVAGTAYHYRVVASNGDGVVDGQEQTFTTQGAGALVLPDGREWELVSPPDKEGSLVEQLGEEVDVQAAAAGGAFTFATDAPTEPQPQGYSGAVQLLSLRGGDGWSARDLTIPHEKATRVPVGDGKEYRVFSTDLSRAIVQPFGDLVGCGSLQPCLSREASEQTAFLADSQQGSGAPCAAGIAGCFEPLVMAGSVPAGVSFGEESECSGVEPQHVICGPEFQGASPDLNHVVLGSSAGLTAGTSGGLYEWSAGEPASAQLAFVSELPAGEGGGPAPGPSLGGFPAENVRGAVSDDGSRVFWSTGSEGGGPLYVRDLAKRETLRVDAGNGVFQAASADGSRVFFTEAGGLFECELVEGAGGVLGCAGGAAQEIGAGVVGAIPGISENGAWVYFVSDAVLAPGAVHGGCSVVPASPPGALCDLYARHDGQTRLVAVLGAADSPDWAGAQPRNLAALAARVSPDGRWFAFMSGRGLTGYDNQDAVTGELDEEVYLYEGESGRLVCASCNPSGARPVGEEAQKTTPINGGIVGSEAWATSSTSLAATVPGWQPYRLKKSVYQPRYLSDRGRLFFDARDPLVPQAVNGSWDVYEYEPEGVPEGVHACSSASVSGGEVFKPARGFVVAGESGEEGAGCVALISSGSSPRESAFLDASENGDDVFFLTAARLSPLDTDEGLDVYDAHVCSGEAPCFPAPVVAAPACETEASCRPAPTPQPAIFGAPASSMFSGPGDLVPALAPVVRVKSAAQVRAEKLAKALKVCRKKHARGKRVVCERQARHAYAARKASVVAGKSGTANSGRRSD